MSINLFGFSPRSFEQFVQAAANHVIGPGVSMFGSGPDGGREATFDGCVPYPFATENWDGYGVVQAKCKEKTEGTFLDQKWALNQIGQELEKFYRLTKRVKKPEYFVFATNVVLTPAVDGGKDSAEKLIRSYYGKLPLKGHAVWDADQFTTFLDSYQELRIRFKSYTTTGDVMAKIIESISSLKPDFISTVSSYIDRQMRDDADARLDQAGHKTEQRTELARVFVDLPTTLEPGKNSPDESFGNFSRGFLSILVETGSGKLDPESLSETRKNLIHNELPLWNDTNRWVLIGGPGSGKSTLTQFLAQIHRAAILERRDQFTVTTESKQIAAQIRKLCEEDKLPWPATPRFPFRIELSVFARALAAKEGGRSISSLIEYLALLLRPDRAVSVDNLLDWLAQYPSLLILDGLDEVPSSSNRDGVCNAIQDFISEATRVKADILILATTRPDGYNNEFGELDCEYRYLPPLSIDRALLYAQRLAETRFPIGSPRVTEMVERLREASDDPLTAKLMISPLQVTFMATLVAAGGRPPKDRWKLFNDYYDTIYKREQQKSDGRLQSIFDNHDALIHKIHHDVGFLLQVHGENPGATDAMMPMTSFEALVERYLTEDGWESEQNKEIRGLIVDEARSRLVFLTSRIAEKISFDVRSLQEYMAAECLMTGNQKSSIERLHAISSLPYWRNVFLFAAGQCFAVSQLHHLRADIKLICEKLNDFELDGALACEYAGSKLALDLMEDGAVSNTPIFSRYFAKIVLEYLNVPIVRYEYETGRSTCDRIARIYDARLELVFKDRLLVLLECSTEVNQRAWAVIVGLIGAGVEWAEVAANSEWPTLPEDRNKVLAAVRTGTEPSEWLTRKAEEVIPILDPHKINDLQIYNSVSNAPNWLISALTANYPNSRNYGLDVKFGFVPEGLIKFSMERVRRDPESISEECISDIILMPDPASIWNFHLSVAAFIISPDKDSLVNILRGIESESELLRANEFPNIPWIVRLCLSDAENYGGLSRIVDDVINDEYGDVDLWESVEKRWRESGVEMDDLECVIEIGRDATFGSKVRFIFSGVCSYHPHSVQRKIAHEIIRKMKFAPNERIKVFLRVVVEYFIGVSYRSKVEDRMPPSLNDWIEVFGLESCGPRGVHSLFSCIWLENIDDNWIEYFNRVGLNSMFVGGYFMSNWQNTLGRHLETAYISNPNLIGLVNWLGALVSLGQAVQLPTVLLSQSKFDRAHLKIAAFKIKISCNFDDDLMETVKQLIALQKENPEFEVFEEVLRPIRFSSSPSRHEKLILALRQSMIGLNPEILSLCDQLLALLVRRRNSSLSERKHAEKLFLPWVDIPV